MKAGEGLPPTLESSRKMSPWKHHRAGRWLADLAGLRGQAEGGLEGELCGVTQG